MSALADAAFGSLLALAAIGLLVVLVQGTAALVHVRRRGPVPRHAPGVSVLKPLCGIEDGLRENLESFARLDWPRYEVVLGVRDAGDPACGVARELAARWPDRFRLVVQRGAPGLNPKVNQLVTLARAARHDLLVVSDSNVRVRPDYLTGIAALLEDPAVGLVTHPVAGAGEERLGSTLDALHMTASIAPGVIAAKLLAGRDIVVGKSMAFRRSDLRALGGFEAAKDVLAEDYVLGLLVTERLHKKVAIARSPVANVTARRSVADFLGRYQRWSVLQRRSAGWALHAAQVVLNPILVAAAALAARPGGGAAAAFCAVCLAKTAIDGVVARGLRPGGFTLRQLALVPLKDLAFGAAWGYGLVRDDVVWRGHRLRVLDGTRIAPPEHGADDGLTAGAASPT